MCAPSLFYDKTPDSFRGARLQKSSWVLGAFATHRLRRVALPRSVRPLRAPGCHRVQERAEEDPAESRTRADHRVGGDTPDSQLLLTLSASPRPRQRTFSLSLYLPVSTSN